jgi:hypothetical protein
VTGCGGEYWHVRHRHTVGLYVRHAGPAAEYGNRGVCVWRRLLSPVSRYPPRSRAQPELTRPAYQDGAGSMSVPLLCFFSFVTGLGSSSAFGGAIKVGTQESSAVDRH